MDEAKMASYGELAKALNLKTVEMNTHLCSLKDLNDELNDRTEKMLTALKNLTGTTSVAAQISCNCCYSRPRTHALLPCGHGGLCANCCERARRRNRCFSCRGEVEQVVRIFL